MKIFLIGFMGAGKSTIGKFSARHNALEFLDLDTYIEQREGLEIREIFRLQGEDHFREIERMALDEVIALEQDLLISCGGGTPCYFDNMARLNAAGVSLYLDLSSARLTDRLRRSKSKRPLLQSIEGDLQHFVHKKLMQRAGFYGQAHIIIPEDKANKHDVSAWIGRILNAEV
ncbi:MAG TPA: shikimate kinase [Bacteroidetes bacterium]|nr:shikimate kinase [Bacteroidota bacterium]